MSIPSDLSEHEISKIIGLTVDIKMNRIEDEIITGVVFSYIKANNLLVLLKKDEKDTLMINSLVVNLKHLKEIKISDRKIDVSISN
jgi:hypothetical protein